MYSRLEENLATRGTNILYDLTMLEFGHVCCALYKYFSKGGYDIDLTFDIDSVTFSIMKFEIDSVQSDNSRYLGNGYTAQYANTFRKSYSQNSLDISMFTNGVFTVSKSPRLQKENTEVIFTSLPRGIQYFNNQPYGSTPWLDLRSLAEAILNFAVPEWNFDKSSFFENALIRHNWDVYNSSCSLEDFLSWLNLLKISKGELRYKETYITASNYLREREFLELSLYFDKLLTMQFCLSGRLFRIRTSKQNILSIEDLLILSNQKNE